MNNTVKELESSDLSKGGLTSGLTVVDFYADWCGPCKAFAPNFHQVASELSGKIQFAKANIDKVQDLAQQFSVRSIPTILILKDGKELTRAVGGMSAADLRDQLNNVIEQKASTIGVKAQTKKCACC